VKVFGCYGGTGLNVRIDRRHVDDAIGEVAFSGPVVGFADSTPSGGGNDERLISFDLRSGRRLHLTPAVVNEGTVSSLVSAIVVKRNGSLAWIVTPNAMLLDYEVSKIDTTGRSRLYAGNDISPTYLVIRRSTIAWQRGASTLLTGTLN
jgi:hypothetical protein